MSIESELLAHLTTNWAKRSKVSGELLNLPANSHATSNTDFSFPKTILMPKIINIRRDAPEFPLTSSIVFGDYLMQIMLRLPKGGTDVNVGESEAWLHRDFLDAIYDHKDVQTSSYLYEFNSSEYPGGMSTKDLDGWIYPILYTFSVRA